MKIYLIDFENVKSKGLTGIDKLDETDSVIIFYSENSDTISFEMHKKVLTSKAEIEYFKVNVGGKNALDFQLSTLLGYLVSKDLYSHIFIVSNDRGFDFLHDFWHGKYVDAPNTVVYRTRTISAAINYAAENSDKIFVDEESEFKEEDKSIDHFEQNALPVQATISLESATENSNSNSEIKQEIEEIAETVSEIKNETEKKSTGISAKHSQKNADNKKAPKKDRRSKNEPTFNEQLSIILSGICSTEDIKIIEEFIAESATKEELHNSLAKIFKQQATEIYKQLRPQYLKLKKLYTQENSSEKTETEESEELLDYSAPDEVKPIYHDVISSKIMELTQNSCTNEDLEKIKHCLIEAGNKQQFYFKMIKAFRKKKGCEYYNLIRSEYINLSKQVQEI